MREEAADKTISRRDFMGAAALGAAALGLGSMVSLSGCSSASSFDVMNEYLPLGSVVKVDTEIQKNPNINLMIVARCPWRTGFIDQNHDLQDVGELYETHDYAAVIHPLGFLSDFSRNDQYQETFFFDKEDIKEVLFLGYQNDAETQAARTLKEHMGEDELGINVLSDLGLAMIDDE